MNPTEDSWPLVLDWIGAAARPVEVLEVPTDAGDATLVVLNVTSKSPMGALALHSGGLLVDRGWLRILGAGHPRVGGGLREWNGLGGEPPVSPPLSGGLVVAYDAIGGFFALNGGGLPGKPGEMVYFAPDTQEQDALGMGYSEYLRFALSGDLDRFYQDLRWPGWQEEVAALGADEVMSFYPFLGFEHTPLQERARRPVPAREAWYLFHALAAQLHASPPGSTVNLKVT
jgi:hypothetical protein